MSFLAGVFGPSREEVWKQLCGEIGAEGISALGGLVLGLTRLGRWV